LRIPVNKYSVRQGPGLAFIQTVDVMKEIIKDQDAPLFKLELWAFNALVEIGGTYVTPKRLFRFRKDAKEVVEWV
jgi:hypothetical protein